MFPETLVPLLFYLLTSTGILESTTDRPSSSGIGVYVSIGWQFGNWGTFVSLILYLEWCTLVHSMSIEEAIEPLQSQRSLLRGSNKKCSQLSISKSVATKIVLYQTPALIFLKEDLWSTDATYLSNTKASLCAGPVMRYSSIPLALLVKNSWHVQLG